MYRFRFIYLLFLVVPGQAAGQAPPLVEFVEGLRARNMADLALDYLQRFFENPPPELRDRITLEIAKTNLDLALQESDDSQRTQRWDQAEGALKKYIAIASEPIANADANLDLARVLTRRARLRLTTSQNPAKDVPAARAAFDAAIACIGAATEKLKAANSSTAQARLAIRIAELQLEEQRIRLYRALTLDEEARTGEIEQIRGRLETLANENDGQPVGWLAKVLVGRCWMELENSLEARKFLDELALQGTKIAPEAQRLLRYYQVLLLSRESSQRIRHNETVRACEEWLTAFRPFENTEEGEGIRITLARSLMAQVSANEQAALSPITRATLLRADKVVRGIAAQFSIYSRTARAIRSDVAHLLAGEQLQLDITKLDSFEEAYLVGQGIAVAARRVAAPPERAARYHRAIAVIEHGLKMATPAEVPKEVVEAQLMLAYLHLICGNNYTVAVLGEYISQSNANSLGAQGAAYAISAYANILANDRANSATVEEILADERRLLAAAQQMLTRWPNNQAADVARFNFGLLNLEAKNYGEAFDQFMSIRETFPAVRDARYRAGSVARIVQAPHIKLDAKRKATMLARAVEALRIINLPVESGDDDALVSACQAKLQLGTLLMFTERTPGTFVEIRRTGESVQAALTEHLAETHLARAWLSAEAERLILSGIVGESYSMLQDGKYDQAHALLIPHATTIERSVKQWAQSPHLQETWFQQLVANRRELMLLYLRACANGDRVSRIPAALECLRAIPLVGGQDVHHSSLLGIASDLNRDLQQARTTKSTSREKSLIAALTAILAEIKRPEELSLQQRVFLAQANSAVDRHDRATAILSSIPEAPGDTEQGRAYRFARIALAREYRLANDYIKAKAVLREILGTPTKKGWGYDNLEARKEAIALMHDERNWAGANRMAVDLQQRLSPSVDEYGQIEEKLRMNQTGTAVDEVAKLDAERQRLKPIREAFFEFYLLELQGIVKSAQNARDANSQAIFDRVATRIAKLEKSHPDLGGPALQWRFGELLQSEPALKSRYLADGGILLAEK